jgi:hypothetical protein
MRQQIVYQNKRSTGLSRLETLPSILLRKINLLLDDEVDEIRLSLEGVGGHHAPVLGKCNKILVLPLWRQSRRLPRE